jgi:hypothetical protein
MRVIAKFLRAGCLRLHEPRHFVFRHGLGISVDEKNCVPAVSGFSPETSDAA